MCYKSSPQEGYFLFFVEIMMISDDPTFFDSISD